MVLHNRTILLCGGAGLSYKCLQLESGIWKEHSTLHNKFISGHSVVRTKLATFIFGGNTYEYLPQDSTKWVIGKTKIPGGEFFEGFAIAVKSEKEIWLIGGMESSKRILIFNVKAHTFRELPSKLIVKTWAGPRCAFIPNTNKIMVTGGLNNDYVQIIDTEDETITTASPMNSKRAYHGMDIVTINGEDRLAVFGGFDGRTKLDSVELYNIKTEKWETSNIKMRGPRSHFAYLSLKLRDIVDLEL